MEVYSRADENVARQPPCEFSPKVRPEFGVFCFVAFDMFVVIAYSPEFKWEMGKIRIICYSESVVRRVVVAGDAHTIESGE